MATFASGYDDLLQTFKVKNYILVHIRQVFSATFRTFHENLKKISHRH